MKIFPVTLTFLIVALVGCDNKSEEKVTVDAECYFSSTKTTATHNTNGDASAFALDFEGKKMSGWAWVQRVTDSVSDATCHVVKPDDK
jgi:uncharacterized lipoprotein NlpE involved in copper resistance